MASARQGNERKGEGEVMLRKGDKQDFEDYGGDSRSGGFVDCVVVDFAEDSRRLMGLG